MRLGKLWNSHSSNVIRIAVASLISACCLQTASAGEADAAADPDAAARSNWRSTIEESTPSAVGCFQASYPEIVWKSVECKEAHPRFHPVFSKPVTGGEEVTGNGHDYVAKAVGLISKTLGTFPSVTGVTHEKSVGVAAFGGGGILGPNEYTLQVNTNFTGTTSACAGHSGCTVWQQFIYSPDYNTKGEAAVFMQYWLIGWGTSACPSTWGSDGGADCYKNSAFVAAPDLKITTLGNQTISGAAVAGGNDTVVFNNGSTAYSVTGSDSVVDISAVWQESEFNVVGNAGGSRAVFNKGSSVTVNVALTDGSASAPACVKNAGSTGETNNLNLGICSKAGGTSPSIKFTESF
jgi:hypothetical protein